MARTYDNRKGHAGTSIARTPDVTQSTKVVDMKRSNEMEAIQQSNIQAERLRDDIMNFNAKKCQEAMEHAQELIEKEKTEQTLRRSAAQRENRFSMVAMSCVVHNGLTFDTMAMLIGMGIGSYLTTDSKRKVGKDGLTKSERKALIAQKRLDAMRKKLENGEHLVPGMGRLEENRLLRTLETSRNLEFNKAGMHVPLKLDDAATMVLGIKSRAVQDALQPGANINEIRRAARVQLENVYSVCATDGIQRGSVDEAAKRMGTMFDGEDAPSLTINVPLKDNDGIIARRPIMSTKLDEAFQALESGMGSLKAVRDAVYGEDENGPKFDFEPISGAHGTRHRDAGNDGPDDAGTSSQNDGGGPRPIVPPVRRLEGDSEGEYEVDSSDGEKDAVEATDSPSKKHESDYGMVPDMTTPARLTDTLDLMAGVDAHFFKDENAERVVGVFGDIQILEDGYWSANSKSVSDAGALADAIVDGVSGKMPSNPAYMPIIDAVNTVVNEARAQGLSEEDVRSGVIGHVRDVLVEQYGSTGVQNPYDGLVEAMCDLKVLQQDLKRRHEADPEGYSKEQLEVDYVSTVKCITNILESEFSEHNEGEYYNIDGHISPDVSDRLDAITSKIGMHAMMCGEGSKFRLMVGAYGGRFVRDSLSSDIVSENYKTGLTSEDGIYCAPFTAEETGEINDENRAEKLAQCVYIENQVFSAYADYCRNNHDRASTKRFTESMHHYQDEVTISMRVPMSDGSGMVIEDDSYYNAGQPGNPNMAPRLSMREGLYVGDEKDVPLHWVFIDSLANKYVETGQRVKFDPQSYQNSAYSRYEYYKQELEQMRGKREITADRYAPDFDPIIEVRDYSIPFADSSEKDDDSPEFGG